MRGADPGERVDVDAAGIDRDADQAGAGALHRGPRRAIAERLDAHDVAGPDDRAGDQVERHLAAARDHDVVGGGREAARVAQEVGEGGAQPGVAGGRGGVAERGGGVAPHRAAVGAGDQLAGHEPQIGDAGGEQDRAGRGHGRSRERRRSVVEREADLAGEAALDADAARRIGDHGPGARHGGEQALGLEVAVRGDHGVAIDAELAGQRAGAGQDVARGEPAAADVVGDRVGDLGEQRGGEGRVGRRDMERGARHAGGSAFSKLDVVDPPES